MQAEEEMRSSEKQKRLPTSVILVAFVVLIGFLGLIAWGLNRAQQGPVGVGQRAPDFDLTTFDGETYDTSSNRDKVILVNFWASWCKPCEQEAADLQEAWEYYQPGGEVLFLGVDYVDTEPEAMEFLNRYQITYPNGPDLRTEISQKYRIRGVPETYVIDRSGKLVFVKKGPFMSLAEIRGVIDQALQ